jgi:hypothetical protein
MHRSAAYVLGIPITVVAVLAYGALQPRDTDLHITYYEATHSNNKVSHAHAFHYYDKDSERIHDIDCSVQEAGSSDNTANNGTAAGNFNAPVSCRRSQWFTLFGFLFAVFAWVPCLLATRGTDSGNVMYKIAYIMFLVSAISLWFGYEHALAMSDHQKTANDAVVKDVSIDHTFPVVLLSSVIFSMLFVIGPLARGLDGAFDMATDGIEKVVGSEAKFSRLDV